MKYAMWGVLALAAMAAAQAEVKLETAFPEGVKPEAAAVTALAPELKDANLIYVADLKVGGSAKAIKYTTDNSATAKPFKTIGYVLYLVGNDGKVQYVCTTMDAFTDDAKKIGVPVLSAKVKFQQKVKNLTVSSNVENVKTGKFPEGNIEFWGTDYVAGNTLKLDGANNGAFDFDDAAASGGNFGSMQVHNFANKQTVFAYNHWRDGAGADVGIGNNAAPASPDWTFARNMKNMKNAVLLVFTK